MQCQIITFLHLTLICLVGKQASLCLERGSNKHKEGSAINIDFRWILYTPPEVSWNREKQIDRERVRYTEKPTGRETIRPKDKANDKCINHWSH